MTECYHQSFDSYDEIESETGEMIYEDVDICRDCNMVIFNGKEMGFAN